MSASDELKEHSAEASNNFNFNLEEVSPAGIPISSETTDQETGAIHDVKAGYATRMTGGNMSHIGENYRHFK